MKDNKQSIAKSAMLVTFMMLCFKFLGFIKQAVIAYVYGANTITDAYFIAWGFVNGVSEAVINALLVSIVAIYTGLRIREGRDKASKLINGLIEVLVPAFIIVAVVLFVFSPVFSRILAPSFQDENRDNVISFIRILSPILVFGCIELIFRSVLDSYRSFFVSRLQSLIYSICVILACFSLSGLLGVRALIVAQYASSVCFSIVLIVAVKKYHSFCLVKINDIPELRNIFITAIPLFVGNSAIQINQIVDKSITSGLGEGATSALSYCHTIEQFVTNIMIVNIGNVMFANFAEFTAKGKIDEIENVLQKAIDLLIALLAAISVITVICSREIVSVVYYRGNFSYESVILTAIALTGYAISFVAVAVRDLSIKSMYAFKDTTHPMNASLISIVINIVLSVCLSRFIGILGVSLATSISAFVGMIINAYFLKRHLVNYRYYKHIVNLMRCIPGMIVLAVICFLVKQNSISESPFVILIIVSAIGFPFYYVVLLLCRADGAKIMIEAFRSKVSKIKKK